MADDFAGYDEDTLTQMVSSRCLERNRTDGQPGCSRTCVFMIYD